MRFLIGVTSEISQISDAQKRWAESQSLLRERPGYIASVSDSLFRPLTDKALTEFGRAADNELVDGPDGKPAKMRALESSSALVCIVFDQLRQRAADQIGSAFGVDEGVLDVQFEVGFPIGLGGTPPTLDLVVVTESGPICGVESKFCEPYRSKDKKEPFAAAYFPRRVGLWTGKGLPRCQEFAKDMNNGAIAFERLDAPQLLKHALSLFNQPKPAILRFVWYDQPSSEADTLRAELEEFGERCNASLGFRSFTYQEVIKSLCNSPDADFQHVAYLRQRYFTAIA